MRRTDSAAQGQEFCETCGSALAYDKSGHILYGGRLSYRDFEQILLSLGASGSDVRRLWPEEVAASSVWVVLVPDYDNYDFELYATREAALAAIKAKVDETVGDWSETFDGRQIEFQRRTPVRGLPTLKQVWSLEEAEVHG